MRKRLLILALALFAVLPTAWAYDFSSTSPSGHTLCYERISGTTNVGVVRPTTSSNSYIAGDVVIPDTVTYNGVTYTVTELRTISDYYGTFSDCSGLTSVTIPNTVTTIGDYAFQSCSGLTSITIPNSVTSIGDYAFWNCSGLTSVTIPNSVTSIGNYAFAYCSGLTSVTIPNSVTSIGEDAFNYVRHIIYNGTATGCPWGALLVNRYVEDEFIYADNTKTSLLAYIGTDTSVTIPNSVTTIGESAFAYCSGLTSVTIPNSVTTIGESAFANLSSLTSVTIPNSVTTIGESAFIRCSGLTSITIPNSVTSIGEFAFQNCTGLTSVTIGNGVTSIGNYVFSLCHGLTSVTIPNSVTSIGEAAFWNCSGLISVTIPSSVTSIGNSAFNLYSSLYKVYLKGINPPSIGDNTFSVGSDFYVPCQSVSNYQNALLWSNYSSRIYGMLVDWEHSCNFIVNDSTLGYVSFTEIDCDSNVVVTVTENIGCQLIGWSDGGMGNPRTFHLTNDTMVTAILDYIPYSVTVQPNDTLRGIVIGSNTVHYGDSVFIEALPNYGYHFTQWDDGNTDNPRLIVVPWDFEDTMVTHNVTYTALFDKNNYNVSLAVDEDIHGSVTGMGTYEYLDACTISAIANDGYRFTHWSDGDSNNTRTITINKDTSITAFFIDSPIPHICMVDVRDGYNTVLWEKGLEVMNYNIYREGDLAGSYEMVASVPYDSLSLWVDSASRPTSRSYRYRMTATDIYGYESEQGDIHKTMHLTINKGIGNQWNLVWTEYEGVAYTTYVIYRGTNASNIQQIDVLPAGGNTTYTDENAQEGEVYYQVGVMVTSPCNPSKSSSIIMSNIATNGNVGIQNIDLSNILVFSKDGKIIVQNTLGKSVQVFDMEGRTIYVTNNTYSNSDEQVVVLVPNSGVYLVKVGEYPAKKVVVVK